MDIEVSCHEDETYELNKWIKINQQRYYKAYFIFQGLKDPKIAVEFFMSRGSLVIRVMTKTIFCYNF